MCLATLTYSTQSYSSSSSSSFIVQSPAPGRWHGIAPCFDGDDKTSSDVVFPSLMVVKSSQLINDAPKTWSQNLINPPLEKIDFLQSIKFWTLKIHKMLASQTKIGSASFSWNKPLKLFSTRSHGHWNRQIPNSLRLELKSKAHSAFCQSILSQQTQGATIRSPLIFTFPKTFLLYCRSQIFDTMVGKLYCRHMANEACTTVTESLKCNWY